VTRIGDTTESTKDTVDKLYLDNCQQAMLQWLSAPDPSINYNKALQQRHKGSGLWFLQSQAFAEWKAQPRSFLWLHGIPGCGKTILSSSVIEHLKSGCSQPLLYFYFDFSDADKQFLESVVRSLISQLYYQRTDAQKHPLDLLFASCNEGHSQPKCESLCYALSRMIEQVEEVWVVLDALDECNTRKGFATEGLLTWIRDLVSSEQRNIHLLLTSRPEQDILSGLADLAYNGKVVTLQSELVSDDIQAYIHSRVREGDGLKRWQKCAVVQDEIEATLMQKANGM
jgi:hypothetical protein